MCLHIRVKFPTADGGVSGVPPPLHYKLSFIICICGEQAPILVCCHIVSVMVKEECVALLNVICHLVCTHGRVELHGYIYGVGCSAEIIASCHCHCNTRDVYPYGVGSICRKRQPDKYCHENEYRQKCFWQI